MVTTLKEAQSEADQCTVVLSIVVPCFNEELGVAQLHQRLCQVRDSFIGGVIREVILVDDGSSDSTWERFQALFGNYPWVKLVRHPANRGITAAIRSGIEASSSPWVATIDADCTYDPLQLQQLASLIDDRVAMITASPYHPKGRVIGVPRWRLVLSKLASSGYRLLFKQKLHTYTSCFRIYRKEVWSRLTISQEGFVGVAEIAWQIDRMGERILEAPAVLTTRKVGFSKMRTVPVIRQHIALMTRILIARLFGKTDRKT
ncbi:MAG: glycosyltransferase family 2 protein [Pirellula sp.]|nr:glycosyltransferase family 2 protein [Pirellula sp.]